MQKSSIDTTHAPSLLPDEKRWQLIWNDEFDGDTLDRTKWDYRLHLMGRRHSTFTDEGAVLDGSGNLLLKLIEKDGHYYSSHLQTGEFCLDRSGEAFFKFTWPIGNIRQPRFMHKYGYYEIRCKLQAQPGWWSAFWLQSPVFGTTINPAVSGVEVNIMENYTRNNKIIHDNHWNGNNQNGDHQFCESGDILLNDTPDGFHHFGCHWSPYGYVFYVDGVETWRCDSPVSHTEQFILISTECMGYRKSDEPDEALKRAILPDCFIVDFVRVYDEDLSYKKA
ncbi:MAG: glycoside hydrolase family 16 protein [Bacillota bacterium]|nr:glycoside hydrolase family 16 protein [Bacillota bacterium]